MWFGNDTVVVIIGILAAIAIPNYIGQQDEAKDSAAMAQLLTAAASQQPYHARQDAFVASARDFEAFGFRRGGQRITVMAPSAITYCMQSPGGNGTFNII